MKKTHTFIALIIFSTKAISGLPGSEISLLGELQLQTEKMLKHLETAQQTLDINHRLEQMEQLKSIRAVSKQGSAIANSINNIKKAGVIANEMKTDTFGTESLNKNITYFKNKINTGGDIEHYARILADLERLKFLGIANDESKKSLAEGANETDNIRTNAVSNTIMADLMLENERKKAAMKAVEMEELNGILKNNNYGRVYE